MRALGPGMILMLLFSAGRVGADSVDQLEADRPEGPTDSSTDKSDNGRAALLKKRAARLTIAPKS